MAVIGWPLRRLYSEQRKPVPLDKLAEEREVKPKTIRNHMSQLGAKVVKCGDNTYAPADDEEYGPPTGIPGSQSFIETGNEERRNGRTDESAQS